jgi:hypothetical protein
MISKIDKIIEYGFYLFVFSLPWQTKLILRQTQLGRGPWEYGTIALFGTDILLVALFIIFVVYHFVNRQKRSADVLSLTGSLDVSETIDPSRGAQDDKSNIENRPAPSRAARATPPERGIFIILSGLDLFIFVSIFFAPDTILAIYRYVLLLLGMGLFWLVVKIKFDNIKLAIAFFSGLVLPSILAIWQFLNQGAFAFKWLGLAAHLPSDLGDSVIETLGADGVPERWLRAYGSLDHPNIMGGLLAIGLLVLIYYFINIKSNLSGVKQKSFENNQALTHPVLARRESTPLERGLVFFYFLLVILFVALIFTFSRSAAAALAAGLLIIFITLIFKKNWPALKKLGIAAVIMAVMFGVIFAGYQNLFITRARIVDRLELKSFSERKMYIDDSFKLIKKHWLFGVGIGNYTKALSVSRPKQPWFYLQPVHNAFLLLWAETGIFSLLFFLALLIYLGAQACRKKSVLSLSILVSLAIMMIFDHYLWSLHFGILFFWLTAGFIYKENI